jgi:hypothetical protein
MVKSVSVSAVLSTICSMYKDVVDSVWLVACQCQGELGTV